MKLNALRNLLLCALLIPAASGCKEDIEQDIVNSQITIREMCIAAGGEPILISKSGSNYDFPKLRSIFKSFVDLVSKSSDSTIDLAIQRVDALCKCGNDTCGIGSICKIDMATGISCTETLDELSILKCEPGDKCKKVWYFDFRLSNQLSTTNTASIDLGSSLMLKLLQNESQQSILRPGKKYHLVGDGIVRIYLHDVDISNLIMRMTEMSEGGMDEDTIKALFISNLHSAYAEIDCTDGGQIKLNRLCGSEGCSNVGRCKDTAKICPYKQGDADLLPRLLQRLQNRDPNTPINPSSVNAAISEEMTQADPICIEGDKDDYLVRCPDSYQTPSIEKIVMSNGTNFVSIVCPYGCSDDYSNCYNNYECQSDDAGKYKCISGYEKGYVGSMLAKCTNDSRSRTGYRWTIDKFICGGMTNPEGYSCKAKYRDKIIADVEALTSWMEDVCTTDLSETTTKTEL